MIVGMHIDIVDYDSGNYETVKSEHEYIEHKITSTKTETEDRGYYGGGPEMGVYSFYEDVETGILTRDVGRYEAWLKTLVTR